MPGEYTSIPEEEIPEAFLSLVVPLLLPTHSKGTQTHINNVLVMSFWLFTFLACDGLDVKYPPKVSCAGVGLLDYRSAVFIP